MNISEQEVIWYIFFILKEVVLLAGMQFSVFFKGSKVKAMILLQNDDFNWSLKKFLSFYDICEELFQLTLTSSATCSTPSKINPNIYFYCKNTYKTQSQFEAKKFKIYKTGNKFWLIFKCLPLTTDSK